MFFHFGTGISTVKMTAKFDIISLCRWHYIFFVHLIPSNGIKTNGKNLWNTYRSAKKVIRMSGKPYILHVKNIIRDDVVIQMVTNAVQKSQSLGKSYEIFVPLV